MATTRTAPTDPVPGDVAADEVVRLRTAVNRLSRELRATRSEAGLTPSQSAVLISLVRSGVPMRLSSLAASERINPTLLSRVVGHLEEHGYVRRSVDPADRRAATVSVTALGRRVVRRLRERHDQILAARIAALDPSQRRALLVALPVIEALAVGEGAT